MHLSLSAGGAGCDAAWSLMASHTLDLSRDVCDEWTSVVTGSLSPCLSLEEAILARQAIESQEWDSLFESNKSLVTHQTLHRSSM